MGGLMMWLEENQEMKKVFHFALTGGLVGCL